MAKNKDKQSKVMGQISAINTLLERYPVLTTTDPMLTNFSINFSMGFLLSLLNLFGVSQSDIIRWLCKILGDDSKVGGGLLNSIEYAIKGILLINVRDILTCAINPNLPDEYLKYANQDGRPDPSGSGMGIKIPLGALDLFGLLFNCPSNENGSVFYFDASENPNELYKSTDFNAFLWYIINKGNITNPTNTLKSTWDNRVKASKVYKNNETLKENFFATNLAPGLPNIPITGGGANFDKKQYIICNYSEANGGKIEVFLNADRYYRTRKIGNLVMNRTIFEFNYDYIYSLKLFDTKTLLANICNSLLGLVSSISASYSFEQNIIKEKVGDIVKKIIQSDDTNENDCYFTFSNDEYNQLLDKVTKEYTGRYTNSDSSYNPDYDNVFNTLRNISSEANKNVDQRTLIGNVIESVLDTTMIKQGIENTHRFNFSIDFINDFLTQTITEIILQVLSPKVTILYAINRAVIGDASNINGLEDLLQDLLNLITSIVKQVKDILIQALYDFVMSELKDILDLFISKIALETIKAYKDLITDLIQNCIPNFTFGYRRTGTIIDNVNYADIIPIQQSPQDNNC